MEEPMKQFHFFYKSIFSPGFISKTRYLPLSKAMIHIFLLAIIISLPMIYEKYVSLELIKVIEANKEKIPEFSITDGTLHLNEEVSSTIIQGKDVSIIFNTESNDLHMYSNNQNAVLFLKNKIVFQKSNRFYSMPNITPGDIPNKESFFSSLKQYEEMAVSTLFIFSIIGYFSNLTFLFVGASALAVVGYIFGSYRHTNVPYRQLWRTAVFSLTSVAVLYFLIEFFYINLSSTQELISLSLISVAMHILAIRKY
jgi:hypothetical protein